jgi:hypothetical protein
MVSLIWLYRLCREKYRKSGCERAYARSHPDFRASISLKTEEPLIFGLTQFAKRYRLIFGLLPFNCVTPEYKGELSEHQEQFNGWLKNKAHRSFDGLCLLWRLTKEEKCLRSFSDACFFAASKMHGASA